MNKIKGILLNGKKAKVVEIEHTLDNIYKLLDCDTIDITSRKIGDRTYYIVCDDEGLLKAGLPVTGIYTTDNYYGFGFVGKIFIVAFDGVDDICSLSEEDIKYIDKFIYNGVLYI